jgi:hypothetical protein
MPQEAHLDTFGNTAGVWPDPCFVRMEGDPDLARPVPGLVAGRFAIVEAAAVASDE